VQLINSLLVHRKQVSEELLSGSHKSACDTKPMFKVVTVHRVPITSHSRKS